jgi:hypothetical protein
MTIPLVRLDIAALDDAEVTAVSDLLDDLGVDGEELYGHLGVVDEMAQLLVFSTDSLHVVFEAMLAAAGTAAASKLADLLRRLPARNGERRLLADRHRGSGFVVDRAALDDQRAMDALVRFDTDALADGVLLSWDAETSRWRPADSDR